MPRNYRISQVCVNITSIITNSHPLLTSLLTLNNTIQAVPWDHSRLLFLCYDTLNCRSESAAGNQDIKGAISIEAVLRWSATTSCKHSRPRLLVTPSRTCRPTWWSMNGFSRTIWKLERQQLMVEVFTARRTSYKG